MKPHEEILEFCQTYNIPDKYLIAILSDFDFSCQFLIISPINSIIPLTGRRTRLKTRQCKEGNDLW